MDTDQSANLLSSIQSEIAKYQLLIEEENQKLKKYKVCSYFIRSILLKPVIFVILYFTLGPFSMDVLTVKVIFPCVRPPPLRFYKGL